MRKLGRISILVGIGVLAAWGMAHAYLGKYDLKRQEILAGCKAARDKMTPEELKQLAARCATPEISLVSPSTVKPGDTVEVTVTGKFPAGTSFLFESDTIEVLKESSVADSYRATIKVNSAGGPEKLAVTAFVPVCCKAKRRSDAIAITGNFAWELKAANGWTVKARSVAPAPGDSRSKELAYALEFYRGAETTPFEKRRATLFPSLSPPSYDLTYYFSISNQDEGSMNAQQEMENLGKQLQNPNLSDNEREKIMKKISDAVDNMTKDLDKKSGPDYVKQLQEKEQAFGCTAINLKLASGVATGNMTCSEKVGRSIALTGTLKSLAK
jgi:FKBP-type peptidyl-prolyl cis-trans isomerase